MTDNASQPPRTPEIVVQRALRKLPRTAPLRDIAAVILTELRLSGYDVHDVLNEPGWGITGGDLTRGAGPDDTCGCGEPITRYEGKWLHNAIRILRSRLAAAGFDDHDARPGSELSHRN